MKQDSPFGAEAGKAAIVTEHGKKKIDRNRNYNLKSEDYDKAETGDMGVSITPTDVFLKGKGEKTGKE